MENSDADGDIDTGWQIELLELIDGAGGWIDDVEQTLVGTDFELFHRLLVDVNRTVDAELLDAGRQRDRPGDAGSGTLCGLHDFLCGTIDRAVIESAQADANFLIFHGGEVV